MNGPGRLSLRARLLVVLIAVTAAFLLIMGGVTALVLSKRLGTHFDDALISAAARSPDQIQANPGDDVAVLITHRFPPALQPLTGNTGTTKELVDALVSVKNAGARIQGPQDTSLKTLKVVALKQEIAQAQGGKTHAEKEKFPGGG